MEEIYWDRFSSNLHALLYIQNMSTVVHITIHASLHQCICKSSYCAEYYAQSVIQLVQLTNFYAELL